MVEVVVDQKPKEQLPYDPNDIPEAVKQRVLNVEKLYSDGNQLQPSETPEVAAPAPQAPVQPVTSPQTSAPTPAPLPPQENENSETWKSRYMGLQGRFTTAQKTIGEQDQLLTQLGTELIHAQQAPQTRPAPQRQPAQQYLTDEDVSNYGNDLLDVTQRAARQAIEPELHEVRQQNAELQRRLAIEARRRLDQAVELAVPNFREVDRNPRWHRWLLGVDVLSGRVRQTLLNEAISSASAPRVISFFKGFLQEEVATGHDEPAPSTERPTPFREPAVPLASLAAPGRARPATGGDASVPSDKPTYTRAQIAQLYRLHQKGAYVGREAEWARQDADIIAAGREGRIR
jgi:hypothetical protein